MAELGGELGPERRAALADKGRRLYGKFCGTGGRGICAESFAVYHIGRGEAAVAEDLAQFLSGQVALLESADPDARVASTRGLLTRIRQHLASAETGGASEGALPQTGGALRQFVLANSQNPFDCDLDPRPRGYSWRRLCQAGALIR